MHTFKAMLLISQAGISNVHDITGAKTKEAIR
jgi:hypothetical protein